MDKVYSTNEEEYGYSDPYEAAQELWGDGEYNIGDIVTIYEGDPVAFSASSFIPNMAEYMGENAYDACGEYSETWDFSREQEKSLQELIEKTVDKWADDNKMQPNFYSVTNVKEIKVKFIDDEGNVEILPASQPNDTSPQNSAAS